MHTPTSVTAESTRRIDPPHLLNGQRKAKAAEVEESVRRELGLVIEEDPLMGAMWEQVKMQALNPRPSLVQGRVGAGKELVSKAVGMLWMPDRLEEGVRPSVVRSTSLSEGVAESEFFGHEKGAFTSAFEKRIGAFESQKDGGSVVLDEIGDVPPKMQAKLLAALESPNEFSRVGSNKTLNFHGKAVSSTHRDLDQMVVDGTFREDLLSRLRAAGVIVVPTLQERSLEHRSLLIDKFLADVAATQGIAENPANLMTPHARGYLLVENFPANVRDLRNVIEQAFFAAYQANTFPIDSHHLQKPKPYNGKQVHSQHSPDAPAGDLRAASENSEREIIIRTLVANNYSRTNTAKQLGISRVTLYNKMKKLGLMEQSSHQPDATA